jgi:hypothetical protein
MSMRTCRHRLVRGEFSCSCFVLGTVFSFEPLSHACAGLQATLSHASINMLLHAAAIKDIAPFMANRQYGHHWSSCMLYHLCMWQRWHGAELQASPLLSLLLLVGGCICHDMQPLTASYCPGQMPLLPMVRASYQPLTSLLPGGGSGSGRGSVRGSKRPSKRLLA